MAKDFIQEIEAVLRKCSMKNVFLRITQNRLENTYAGGTSVFDLVTIIFL